MLMLDLPSGGLETTKIEGTRLESLGTMRGFHQVISQPNHLMPQTSSYIYLIFTDNQI